MKKILSFLGIFSLSAAFIFFLTSAIHAPKDKIIAQVDLAETQKLYEWKKNTKTFQELSVPVSRAQWIFYKKFSPIDGIYYQSTAKEPIKIQKNGGSTILEFDKGIFICDIEDATVHYELRINGLSITPLDRGVFLIDTTKKETTIFSYNAFLWIELFYGKHISATSFTLFPSLLFRYDPSNSSELKGADIIRVATIDSIRYLDARDKVNIASIFWQENKEAMEFFLTVNDAIVQRMQAFNTMYRETIDFDSKKLKQNGWVDPESPLFVNTSKKEIILKNILLEKIIATLKNEKLNDRAAKEWLASILNSMKQISPELYNKGINILKKYYYIATFASIAEENKEYIYSGREKSYIQAVNSIINTADSGRSGYYYGMSTLFSRYYFSELASTDLNASLKEYLRALLDEKTIKKNEFLSFSFFLTQYLSVGASIADEDTFQIVFNLFQVTNEYYSTLTDDRRSVALSTIFYSYNKSFTKLLQIFTDTFFEMVPTKWLALKSQYINDGMPTFGQSFIDMFVNLSDTLGRDLAKKKQPFYTGRSASDLDVNDNYNLLLQTSAQMNTMSDILTNYPDYAKNFELNARNKNARGIVIVQTEIMSRDALEKYLTNFNNVNIGTLQITNNFLKDGFYDIRIDILGNTFSFKLTPAWHTISDVSYKDSEWKSRAFPNTLIALDAKEKMMKDQFQDAEDPNMKYRYDFKNFFTTVFIQGADTPQTLPIVNTELPADKPPMDKDIQVWVQKELLDKDFKNIRDILPMGFSNIYATIKNGSYAIELSSLKKTFSWISDSYAAELTSNYVFARHTFYQLSLRAKTMDGLDEFGGNSVEILPARILLTSLGEYFQTMGVYLDSIKKNYQWQTSLEIDFTQKEVRLDGKVFTPDFTSIR